ncbi:hypothetical protein BXZ70DRAFT_464961 [Cristinia sonorae]|uniref:F-box domain-containing protein n=1 Tax=Cristinia sonorae TaxID=1940300 RepID=A0A8K0UIM1_9AGAR|nr:hypothetical protein BXZ70DRAFT_464961 [Cristinia sonorae]
MQATLDPSTLIIPSILDGTPVSPSLPQLDISVRAQNETFRLPLEVCELIIDIAAEFWDYFDFLAQPRRTTLRSCALTCKAWLPRCRYHLFYASDLLESSEHLLGYVGMLRAHPELTSLVRRLRISGSFDDSKAYWINSLPILLSPLLPNLNHVVYTAQVSKHLAPFHPTFFRLLSTFRPVTQLHYTCNAKQPFDNFAKFVLAFRNLERLHVDGESEWILEKPNFDQAVVERPPLVTRRSWDKLLPLHHLHTSPYLVQRNLIHVVEFVLQRIDVTALKTIEIWDIRWREKDGEGIRAVGDLINACPNLRRVLLHITLLGGKAKNPGYISLGNNTQLRKLELQINYLPDSLPMFQQILSSISSPHLNHLTLRFNADARDIEHVVATSPNHIDDVLTLGRFKGLNVLSTDIPAMYWPKLFRRTSQRGGLLLEQVERMESERLHELRHHVK